MATQPIIEKKPVQPETALAVTPAQLLQVAVSQGADLDKLSKLMDLQERWEKNEARKAFVAAMTTFKMAPPTITKNKPVKFGQTEYSHATLDHVCGAITKGLSAVGISHRWKVDQVDNVIRVTCILTHDLGHSEETTLQGAADTSGSKNSIQAIGSTVTYLQRYTLLAATGLAAGNDDDGRSAATFGELAERIEWIENCQNEEELRKVFTAAYKEARTAKDQTSQNALIAAKDKKLREIHNA